MAFVLSIAPSLTRLQGRSVCCSRIRSSLFLGAQLQRPRSRTITSSLGALPPRHRAWAMNISSNDFRPGTTIELDGIAHRVVEFMHVKPGKGAAFVRTKLRNVKTGNTIDKTFKAGEMVPSANLEKVQMQHTYVDGDDYVFMNMESFEEERMTASVLGDNVLKFLSMGLDVQVLKHNDDILGVEIPKSMSFKVIHTDPGVKGNTAQGGGTKPATIETGAEVMVPLFIETGEKINVSTEDGKYLSRDNT